VRELAVAIVPNPAADHATVLQAAVALVRTREWGEAEPAVLELLDLLRARGDAGAAGFAAIEGLAAAFAEVGRFAQPIWETFVLTVVDPPIAEVMAMVRAMRCGWVNFEWMVVAAVWAFGRWDSEAIRQSVRAIVRVLREKDHKGVMEVMQIGGERLMLACFTALADGMHGAEFDLFVKLVRKMSIFLSEGRPFTEEWKMMIVSLLAAVATEPKEGIFMEFAIHLSAVHTDKAAFREAFVNLLVVLKKLSPGDTNVFSRNVPIRDLDLAFAFGNHFPVDQVMMDFDEMYEA
jgi:hypothetical protein